MTQHVMYQSTVTRREFVARLGGFLTPYHLIKSLKLSSCGPHSFDADNSLAAQIKSFSRDDRMLRAFGKQRPVFWRGDGPSVLVLHELPGMTPFDIDFAFRLSKTFRVYLPLLFGEPGEDRFERRLLGECVFGPWPWEEFEPKHPWIPPLLKLIEAIHERAPSRIGVVGMCLTGMLPISLMASPHVVAPVICQPTMPLPIDDERAASLGIPSADITHAQGRVIREQLQVLAFRATTDCYCPSARFNTLGSTFSDRLIRCDIDFNGAHGHSILAAEYHRPDLSPVVMARVRAAFDDTVDFLNKHLRS
jgi:dienelactone hydrolase